MEVLLLQDVNGIGKKDDLLVVGDGYALNHLLPLSKALVATPTVRRRYAEKIRDRAIAREQERALQSRTASALSDIELNFTRKVTKTGKLYAAITEKNISEGLKDQHSLEVKDSAIAIAEPIKALGEFEVTITLAENEQKVKVVVAEEK